MKSQRQPLSLALALLVCQSSFAWQAPAGAVIGAKQKDIIRQFLTEAVLISIMGGLLGIIFGVSLAHIIASAAGWSTVVTTGSIAVAFGVSCGIGLVFGIYPAMQAARLDPIEAIRYE